MIDWIIPWWGWFLLGFTLLLLEISTPGGFYFLFFGAGAISVGILSWSGAIEQAWVQLIFFSMLSVVSTFLFRKRLLERFGPRTAGEPVDSIVGEAGTVMDNIEAGGFGKVELRGTSWNAKNSGGRMLMRGERCTVERVDGLSLWVHKEE